MSKGVEIDLHPDTHEPRTLNLKTPKWASGTLVQARLKQSDPYQPATIINRGYKDGRWIGGYIVRFDGDGTTHIIGYEYTGSLITLRV